MLHQYFLKYSKNIRTSLKSRAFLLLLSSCLASGALAAPKIVEGAAVNAANYISGALPNGGLARGSMFVVFGSELGPPALRQVDKFPLPTELAGTSVQLRAGGVRYDCFLVYVSAGQLAAIVPSNVPAGQASLTVTTGNQASNSITVRIVDHAFGIFSRNQAGTGPAVVQNFQDPVTLPVNSLIQSAKPGQYVIVWGTGLGAIAGNDAAGPAPGDLNIPLQLLVGGKEAKVIYRGRSGCCAGIDQIVAELPLGVEGCYVPLYAKVGGVVSNSVSISISRSGPVCSDELGLSAEELSAIAKGEPVSVGDIMLDRFIQTVAMPEFAGRQFFDDIAYASFGRWRPSDFLASLSPVKVTTLGSCSAFSTNDGKESPSNPASIKPEYFNAGPGLNLRGPVGPRQITRQPDGTYFGVLSTQQAPNYLKAGRYTVGASGSTGFAPFEITIEIPDDLRWTNETQINEVQRNRDLRVTWDGAGRSGEHVEIYGFSFSQGGKTGAGFSCGATVSAGQFVVPSDILSVLPPSGQSQMGFPDGILGISFVSDPQRFSHPNLDVAMKGYSLSRERYLMYR